jgi:inhibitor of KinA sporulation pathway (predicted exonuclease)
MMTNQQFHHLLVLDFEASCDDNNKSYQNEIIEFPTVVFNTTTLEIEDEFHHYVQPTINKQITAFCSELTGIQQEWIDNGQSSLHSCLQTFHQWMINKEFIIEKQEESNEYAYELNPEKTFQFVTCGDWYVLK